MQIRAQCVTGCGAALEDTLSAIPFLLAGFVAGAMLLALTLWMSTAFSFPPIIVVGLFFLALAPLISLKFWLRWKTSREGDTTLIIRDDGLEVQSLLQINGMTRLAWRSIVDCKVKKVMRQRCIVTIKAESEADPLSRFIWSFALCGTYLEVVRFVDELKARSRKISCHR